MTGCVEGRKVNGALYFIRLHDDIQEVTSDGVRKILKMAEDIAKNSKKRSPKRKPLSKKEVEELVRNFRVDEILKVAKDDRKIVRNLMRLLYSVEDEYRMRAAEMLGIVTQQITSLPYSSFKRSGLQSTRLRGLDAWIPWNRGNKRRSGRSVWGHQTDRYL